MTTLEATERALARGKRLFSPATVAELVRALRTLEQERAGLLATIDTLLTELELHGPQH